MNTILITGTTSVMAPKSKNDSGGSSRSQRKLTFLQF
jgi:hypothetical protein